MMRRALVAMKLVHLSAWFIERAYVTGQVNGHHGRERAWAYYTRWLGKKLIVVACRLDGEAATTQMIEEAWWG